MNEKEIDYSRRQERKREEQEKRRLELGFDLIILAILLYLIFR